jgi:hypothetical protein
MLYYNTIMSEKDELELQRRLDEAIALADQGGVGRGTKQRRIAKVVNLENMMKDLKRSQLWPGTFGAAVGPLGPVYHDRGHPPGAGTIGGSGGKSKRKSIRKSRRKLSRKSIRKSKRKPKRKLSRKSNVHKRSKIRKKVMRGGGWNEVEQVWKPESRKIYIGSEGEVRGSRPVNKNDRSEMVFPHPKGSPEDDYSEKQDKARQLDLIAQLIDQRSRTPRAAAAPGSAV